MNILQKFRGKKWFAKLCFFLIVKVGWAGNTQQKRWDMKDTEKNKNEGDTAGNQQKISSHTNHQASKIQNSYLQK